VLFRLAGREFAVPLARVVEVSRYIAPTPVPWRDPAVAGILPRRGRMVTVVDARVRLGLPPRAEGETAQVIILDAGADGYFGLVVDRVMGVAPRCDAGTSPGTGPAPAGSGPAPPDDAQVALLDLDAVLRGPS
jgi:purine-binding chemotaxis protein CheW